VNAVVAPSVQTSRSLLSLGLARTRYELKLFFRNKEAVGFTLAFPVVLLVLFGAIFSNNKIQDTSVSFGQVVVAGIVASGIASVTFVNMAISIATERDAGTLKRLAGTPMPKAAYFLGKIGLVTVTAVLETAILLVVGATFYGIHLPSDPWRWFTFGWVFVLGLISCTLLGIAMSAVPRSAKSAGPVVNLPFVALQFISGVYVLFQDIPKGLQVVASFLPLKWLAQGFRSVFLPQSYAHVEVAGSWEHPRVALVLALWCVAGFVLAAVTFRWQGRDER
jgi:ABC-2 type transport system permease protein